MKTIATILALATALASAAAARPPLTGDHPVLIQADRGQRVDLMEPLPPVGAVLPLAKVRTILYLDVPCKLPLVDTKGMYQMADNTGVGCWYPTLDRGYTIIQETGYTFHAPWLEHSFEVAVFHVESRTFTVKREDATGLFFGSGQ